MGAVFRLCLMLCLQAQKGVGPSYRSWVFDAFEGPW